MISIKGVASDRCNIRECLTPHPEECEKWKLELKVIKY